jgi:hypothetical protein
MMTRWREGIETSSSQDQFRNMNKASVFRKTCGSNAGDISREKGDQTKE